MNNLTGSNPRYQVINMAIQFTAMETNSFSRAISYATENDLVVFDTEKKKIIYDGYLDQFCG